MSSGRSFALVVLACAALMAAVAGATQYSVGGDNGWAVPGAGAESYNTWAEKTGFQVGDQLLFVYPKDKDSVLLVQPADYNACNTSSYDKQFTDGNTVFDLDRAGAFFFISGVDANCRANEKLIVMVSAAAAGKGAPAPSQGSPTTPSPPSADAGAGAGQSPPSPTNAPATPNTPPTASNSTAPKGTPPGASVSGAGLTAVVGLAGSFVACIGYAVLAF
uniref:Uncharacterized protein n=1 Tax=Avena sativa TaxID=4498 RepID=A0ACD5V5L8_AVESA